MKKWRTVGGVVLGLAVCLTLLYFIFPARGPVAQSYRGDGAFAESWSGQVHQAVTMGGYPLENRTGGPETVLRVSPGNRPAHLKLVLGVDQVPPALGVMTGFRAGHWHATPHTFASSDGREGWWEPVIGMEANRPGNYVVHGLWVTYRWNQMTFKAYLPGQFQICAGATVAPKSCPNDVRSGPTSRRLSFFSWFKLVFL